LLPKLLDDSSIRMEALKAIPLAVSKAETTSVMELAKTVVSKYSKWTSVEKQAAAAGLASQSSTALTLLEAVRDTTIPRADISSFVARQIVNLRQPKLTEMLEKVWGRVTTDAATTASAAAEVAKWQKILTPAFFKKASRSTGRELFKSVCATCHTLYGEGGKIGPDLTGSNRADLSYLLENIANPNAILGQDYELHVFALKNGQSVAGMIRNETDTAFTVQTLVNEEVVSKTNITEHSKPGISMMPPGLLTALQPEQVRDLLSYLSHNEQVPLPGEKGADSIYRVAGVLEGESMKVLTAGLSVGPQDMRGYKDGQWSGGNQLWWTGGKPGSKLTLSLPVATAGKYLIEAVLTRAVDYGVVTFQLDGKPLGDKAIDLFGSKVSNSSVNLGETTLNAEDHQLTIEITGANPQAVKGYMFGLDYIRLVPQK
jgi:putative heme-binding domain-containing protein